MTQLNESKQGGVSLAIVEPHPGLYLRLLQWIGDISHSLWPHLARCMRCRRAWAIVKPHITRYSTRKGCQPLCEGCWRTLTPQTRLPYYKRLRDLWITLIPNKEFSEILNPSPLRPVGTRSHGMVDRFYEVNYDDEYQRIMDDWARIKAAVLSGR